MVKRMLIDATYPEETRVVVLNGSRLEEFDFETSTKKQLKGNIYLAKVTRVEPSLQAAFVDYGGNRHGFLSFAEIHPDYYQIPVADRQFLDAEADRQAARPAGNGSGEGTDGGGDGAEPEPEPEETGEDEAASEGATSEVELVGGEQIDELESDRPPLTRRYNIQEVIRHRLILLVQVAKEERGNKGAALTTYLSIAGRYCVLMPNAPRGGGISRKIVDQEHRKRLRAIADELEVPEGMGLILRTAGMERTKAEIKRDFDYLLKLWDETRELTLKSTAPTLIYEEGNLIKRSIRDLYTKDIKEVLVEGEDGYSTAKGFMKHLIPSHAKRVQPYRDRIPLFHRHQVESQLDAMHNPVVQLKSGGYIVINPTEALVAIDVNSGRATKERNIGATALKTNLEAADEIARQLRLRDLSGLIVIDFIDMDDHKNDRAVERKLKEALKADRARIQAGRISPFGLLELSRQRLRPSLIEASTEVCPYCGGIGRLRSTESLTLHALRTIEEEGIRERSSEITVTVPTPVALYLMNHKREALRAIEQRYGLRVFIAADDHQMPPDIGLERIKTRRQAGEVRAGEGTAEKPVEPGEIALPGVEEAEEVTEAQEERAKKRRRRRRKRAEAEEPAAKAVAEPEPEGEAAAVREAAAEAQPQAPAEGPRKSRRRSRRGGRRRGRGASDAKARPAAAKSAAEAGAEAPALADKGPDEVAAAVSAAAEAFDKDEPPEAMAEPVKEKVPAALAESEGEKRVTKAAGQRSAKAKSAKKPRQPRRRTSRSRRKKADGEAQETSTAAPEGVGQ
ncbi:MAG: ribonuclease E/G, partial [Alphaproteobacteria bacterium]